MPLKWLERKDVNVSWSGWAEGWESLEWNSPKAWDSCDHRAVQGAPNTRESDRLPTNTPYANAGKWQKAGVKVANPYFRDRKCSEITFSCCLLLQLWFRKEEALEKRWRSCCRDIRMVADKYGSGSRKGKSSQSYRGYWWSFEDPRAQIMHVFIRWLRISRFRTDHIRLYQEFFRGSPGLESK